MDPKLVLFGHDLSGTHANRPSNSQEGQPYFDTDLGIWVAYSGTQWNAMNGLLSRQVSSAGINPGATAADNVLAVYSIPANYFDVANRGIRITASGSYAATANNKQVKIIVNPATAVVGSTVGASGTTLADTGTVATNNGAWRLSARVTKYGAANSNTQLGISDGAQSAGTMAALSLPAAITATENAAILVAITGNATTAATDIVFKQLDIESIG